MRNFTYPFFLSPESVPDLFRYLKDRGWSPSNHEISKVEKPGEGNMNCVLRVVFADGTSVILKQARPWVEKFPHLEAPVERIAVEAAYYRNGFSSSPTVIGFDPESHVLAMEDLGEASDLTAIYATGSIKKETLNSIASYIREVQQAPTDGVALNLDLRKLNHQHVFVLPFQSGIGFEPNPALYVRIAELGDRYLSKGQTLVHGDLYPGSILDVRRGLKVIDPEFSFVGPFEWDAAVFTAHLFMARVPMDTIRQFRAMIPMPAQFSTADFSGFVGIEILRRIKGLAKLPLVLTKEEELTLVESACGWILEGRIGDIE